MVSLSDHDPWSSYEKRSGTGGIQGQEYEYKMCCLMFLRGIRSGRFHLAANVQNAGAFDDVVLHQHSPDGGPRSYFIQLKHKLKSAVQPRNMLLSILSRNDYSLLKYFASYRDEILQKPQTFGYDCCPVLYTNAKIQGQPEVSECVDEVLNSRGTVFVFREDRDVDVFRLAEHIEMFRTFLQDLLERLQGMEDVSAAITGDASRFMKDYKSNYLKKKLSGSVSIWEMANTLKRNPKKEQIMFFLNKISDLGDLSGYVAFVKKLKVCTQQVTSTEIDFLIKDELVCILRLSSNNIESVFSKLVHKIRSWWSAVKGTYLTEQHTLWSEIISVVLHKVNKPVMEQLSDLKLKFNKNELKTLRETLSANRVVLTIANGKHAELSVLKVVNVLERMRRRFVLGPSEDAVRFWESPWCQVLVLDSRTGADRVAQAADILKDNTDKKLVVVTRASEDRTISVVRNLVPEYVEFNDDINLTSLQWGTQNEILGMKVDYQGYQVTLKDLICDHVKDNENVGYILEMLKELYKKMCLFQNRSELESSEKLLPFIKSVAFRRGLFRQECKREIASSIILELMIDEGKLSSELNMFTVTQKEIKTVLMAPSPIRALKKIIKSLNAKRDQMELRDRGDVDLMLVMLNGLVKLRDVSGRDDVVQSDTLMKMQLEEDSLRDCLKGIAGRYILKRRKINSAVRKLSQDMELLNKVHNYLEIKEAIGPLLSQLDEDVAYLATLYRQGMLKQALTSDLIYEMLKGNPVRIGTELQTPVANYIPRTLRREELVRPESAMDIPERVVVVVGEPGMGKSTFLSHVALNTKQADPTTWTLRVNLNRMTHCLSDVNTSNFTLGDCIDFLAVAAGVTESFELLLLEHSLKASGKIVVLLDGFDEIYPVYIRQMDCIIGEIIKTKCSKIWIMSRPYLKGDLQSYCSSQPFSMNEFSSDDQKNFLTNIWIKHNTDAANISPFIDEVLQMMPVSLNGEGNFMGIPLQTMMVADVFERDLVAGRVRPAGIDLIGLYDMFFSKKCAIYFKDRRRDDEHNPEVMAEKERILKEIEENHEMAALSLLLPHEDLITLHDGDIKEKTSQFLESKGARWPAIGIINGVEDGKPQFLHRTIAEFLVSKWLERHYPDNTIFIENVLFSEYYFLVRKMFDSSLSKTFTMHTSVLNGDICGLRIDSENANAVDSGGRTLLHLLAAYTPSRGSLQAMKHLLNNRADANILDKVLKWSAIKYANKISNWGAVDLLLERTTDIPQLCFTNESRAEALEASCTNGYLKLLKYLVRERVDLNMRLNDALPLHIAIRHNQGAVVSYLLNTHRDNRNIMKRMFRNTVDVRKKSATGTTALHCAVSSQRLYIAQLLVEGGCDVNTGDCDNETPLHYSAREGYLHMAMLLIGAGCKVNPVDRRQKIPLHHAVAHGHLEIVQLLVDNGSKLDVLDADSQTPLHYAVKNDYIDILNLLLDSGSNVNARGEHKRTALHLAVQRNSIDVVKRLITAGCDMYVRDIYGLSALDYAHKSDCRDMCVVLLESGCKIRMFVGSGKSFPSTSRTKNGCGLLKSGKNEALRVDFDTQVVAKSGPETMWLRTPIDNIFSNVRDRPWDLVTDRTSMIAIGTGINLAEVFNMGVEPNSGLGGYCNSDEWPYRDMCTTRRRVTVTRLLSAAWNGDLHTVLDLVENGVDVNARDLYNRKTALHNSAEQGHVAVVALLTSSGADVTRTDFLDRTPMDLAVSWQHKEVALLLKMAEEKQRHKKHN